MRREHITYWLKRRYERFESAWTNHFVRPQFDAMGDSFKFAKPWNIHIYGPNITLGDHTHIITDRDRRVRFSVWRHGDNAGAIHIADHCLICPGVRFDSAASITVGDSCMFASGAYLTDADWHDLYDRSAAVGAHAPVVLEDNVWIGDGAIVCKGVRIGENSVIGAGAVVTRDIPANSIAAGNPAKVVRTLDPTKPLTRRAALFADPLASQHYLDDLDRYLLAGNTPWGWLRARFFPRRGD